MWIDRPIQRIVWLAVMIPWNGNDEAGILLIGLIKIVAVHADVAGKIYDISQVIKKCGLAVAGQALRVLLHHGGNKILLLAPMVACVPHGMEDHGSVFNRVDVTCGEQLREIESVGWRPIRGGKRLKWIAWKLRAAGLNL